MAAQAREFWLPVLKKSNRKSRGILATTVRTCFAICFLLASTASAVVTPSAWNPGRVRRRAEKRVRAHLDRITGLPAIDVLAEDLLSRQSPRHLKPGLALHLLRHHNDEPSVSGGGSCFGSQFHLDTRSGGEQTSYKEKQRRAHEGIILASNSSTRNSVSPSSPTSNNWHTFGWLTRASERASRQSRSRTSAVSPPRMVLIATARLVDYPHAAFADSAHNPVVPDRLRHRHQH